MEREQEEMQFLGVFDIFIEAYKIVYKWRKIFTQITFSLILPLSFILLAHMEISHLISSKIHSTNRQLHHTRFGTSNHDKLTQLISSEIAILWLFRLAYFTFLLIFSLLSTAAVVYTIACIYTARDITFKKVLSVVPKVWKRLIVTFLTIFVAFIGYNVFATVVIILWAFTLGNTAAEAPTLILLLICYLLGFVYMTMIWQLASVVSVLEDSYGFKAMVKSKDLIKGKIWVSVIIFFLLNLSLAGIDYLFRNGVVRRRGWSLGVVEKVGLGLGCLILMLTLNLFSLVIPTIIYFVCKSYHHENIDKSSLSDHLEVYLGEYVPLKEGKDVQLQEYRV